MSELYLINGDGGKIQVTVELLKELARWGRLDPESRLEARGKTVPARKIKELAEYFEAQAAKGEPKAGARAAKTGDESTSVLSGGLTLAQRWLTIATILLAIGWLASLVLADGLILLDARDRLDSISEISRRTLGIMAALTVSISAPFAGLIALVQGIRAGLTAGAEDSES